MSGPLSTHALALPDGDPGPDAPNGTERDARDGGNGRAGGCCGHGRDVNGLPEY